MVSVKRTKKWLLCLLLTVLAAALLSIGALASDATLADLRVTVNGQTILPSNIRGETRFFLPSHADLHAVEMQFSVADDAAVTVGETLLQSGDAVDVAANAAYSADDGVYTLTYTVTPAEGDAQTGRLCFMKSENVGAMFLSVADAAYGRAWIDGSPNHSNDAGKKTSVFMKMQTADATVVYDGKLTSLKGRGNTTWGSHAKKPYQIKLDKKTDLLSSGNKENKNKTWVLLANALDKTLFKTAFALDLARYLGLKETPEYTYVNLYFDGEYRGLYQLTEKVQINPGRVKIADLEEHNTVTDETATAQGTNSLGLAYQYNPTAVCDTDDISGGYLLEMDTAFYRSENSWFQLFNGNVVVVKSPECCTEAQMKYVSVRFNQAIQAAQTNKSGKQSVLELLDLDSHASVYMVNEYLKNIDFTYSSTYFFLPEEGNGTYAHKFYAGPAWDFDTSLGNRTENASLRDPTGLSHIRHTLYQGSIVRAFIKEKAKVVDALFDTVFSDAPAETNGVRSLSWHKARLDAAQKMNFTLWAFDDTSNTFAKPSYDENCSYVRDFLKTRHKDIFPRLAALQSSDYAALQNCINGNHTVVSLEKEPTCTEGGHHGASCSVCETVISGEGSVPALGHVDDNGDKLCDRCGKYAGKTPKGLEWLYRFFAKVVLFWKRLFGVK